MKLYALHDKKAKHLSSFHVERGDTMASRSFAEAVTQANSVFAKYPDDFELVSLCDVSQDYEDLGAVQFEVENGGVLGGFEFRVVLTARQVMDLQPKQDGQLSLLKEA